MGERAEGWVAGLRLTVLSLAGHPDPERFAEELSSRRCNRCAIIISILPPAWQTEHDMLLGECQCGGKRRLPLPEEHAHVGSVLPGPLGFH